MVALRAFRPLLLLCLIALAVPIAFAQQVGSISGKITAVDGSALPGVTVEASSNVLPQARVTTSTENGDYSLPALQPGTYTVKFSLAGMETVSRTVQVLLSQNANVDVKLGLAGVAEEITVTARAALIDVKSTEISSAISSDVIEDLPVGQEYRDLIKLSPGIQNTEDAVRGPSAGGSGQDNTYNFDGVNVTLPLFGTLSADPSSHDIAQVTVVKGGADATEFNRAGGFLIDSVSKSGTNEFQGQVSVQAQTSGLTSEQKRGTNKIYDEDRMWATASLGGPILSDQLFFYGSYYRPTRSRANSATLYGPVPDYDSTRDEAFGKLTWTPMGSVLINGSYRASKVVEDAASIGGAEAGTASVGNESKLRIGILETSWVINNRSFATGKFTDFKNDTGGAPDLVLSVVPSTAIGTQLDLNNLDQMGLFVVPCPIGRPAGAPCQISAAPSNAVNTFIAPYIAKYGYVGANGERTGGGSVGAGTQFDNDDFFRKSAQVAYNLTLGSAVAHDLHVGYQWFEDSEDLLRSSNGWGVVSAPGGNINFQGTPVFFQAAFQQQGLGLAKPIHSVYRSNNIEFNDSIRFGNWTVNLGVLASNDKLYGQGLREDSSTISGYVAEIGHQYLMHEIKYSDMIQPRLGFTWTYNGQDNIFASFARYHPPASSLPRAASWARNLATTINAYFDKDGKLFAVDPVASSSGKLFVDGIKPRKTDEILLGTSQQITSRWTGRAYGRYRYSNHFWEDTNNNARIAFNAPAGIPQELYIPDLTAKRNQIGSGSTYVIAELDGAFNKYYEATAESDWNGNKVFLRGSYTWSHYYGNFDQDNTSLDFNDSNIFIGSSIIADGAGRQLWDHHYGNLRGDRRHLLKVFGTYKLPWKASAGAYAFYQSGQPWEAWSYEPYKALTTSTSDQFRLLENAGSRTSPAHYQLDLNYTHDVLVMHGFDLQLRLDMYNVFDKQTGYNIEPSVHRALFGQPRSFWGPRRLQVAAILQF